MDYISLLGHGAFGYVHLMRHRETGLNLAVKVCMNVFGIIDYL